MEDEDVDYITKIDAVSVVDNKLPCVPVCKDIYKIISSESNTVSRSEEDVSDKNLVVKLKTVSNHQESLNTCVETEDSVRSELTEDPTVSSPKKVNGEVDKNETIVSEEDSYDFKKIDEPVKDLKTKEILVSELEPSNKRKHSSSDGSDELNPSDEESENKTSSGSSPVEFRGFKKRKLLETESEKAGVSEIDLPGEDESNVVCEPTKPKVPELRRSARNATMAKRKSNELVVEQKEENGDQLTEYAQYLGLQPTVKFKCGRCGEKHFQSMGSLNAHQKICSKSGSNALVKPSKPPGDSNISTNFRITRKVYLCSACGTYYENWKLFLHMRDMHKRHICLFCLGMFSVADKLAEHLLFKHNVHEKTCKSPEEFLNLFKGSCYLTCCSCEKMFTEREDFFDHQCKDSIFATSTLNKDSVVLTSKDNAHKCTLCGIKCGHFQSCPNIHNNKLLNVTTPSTSVNSKNSTSTSPSNMSLTKFYIPVPPSVQKEWNNKSVTPTNARPVTTTSDKDDYYDVGNAASFCHVDIATNDSDTQTSPDKLRTEKINSESKTYSRQENHRKSPSISTDNGENVTNDESSKTFVSINENSSSSDESFLEKNENDSHSEANERCVDENNTAQNNPNEKNDVDGEDEDINMIDDANDADDEQNSSEDCATKTEKSLEKVDDDDDASSSDPDSGDKKDESTSNENPVIPCYIKLDRLDEKLPESKTDQDSSKIDDVCDSGDEKLDSKAEENTPASCSDDVDNICANDISNSNNDSNSSSNLKITNSSSNESISSKDQKASETSKNQLKNSDDVTDDERKSEKENINSDDDNRLDNQASPLMAENGFKNSESKDSLDKFDESEDSDKLSVVLSEDGSEDNEQDETRDDMMSVNDQDNSNQETNSDHENANCTDNETYKQTDVSNDINVLHNGNETIDNSNNVESQNNNNSSSIARKEDHFKIDGEKFQLASEEVMAMALTLEDKMDSLSSQSVVKECVRTSCTTCSYCSHAVKIGVNGKQLALHLLAEHRYMPVKNETIDDVIERLKHSLDELKDIWFNTDSYDSSDKSCFVPYDHTYECFQCNYVTNLHKDLYLHYRKVHQKNILYCCMCKANFSSYSELICHMCPGVYVSKDIQFRCCFCQLDRIPSAFRLMVHLRKFHHTCDVCFEIADDQQKLSMHMWKHKLNHSCYRCGISYRNKPDITKHLFWKHGTESVLCKKCLHKRWPHVYHFCVPPTVFTCEECNLSFSKAVILKVHKRMHSGEHPYSCTSCDQKFVSKKLLLKHEKTHNVVLAEDNSKSDVLLAPEESQKTSDPVLSKVNDASIPPSESKVDVPQEKEKPAETPPVKQHKKKSKKDREKKSKPIVDVYDLPPLNLSSESDDSDDEKDVKASQINSEENREKEIVPSDNVESNKEDNVTAKGDLLLGLMEEQSSKLKSNDATVAEPGTDNEENVQPITVDGIWDSFHSYKAEQEKRGNIDINNKPSILSESDAAPPIDPADTFLVDHDYCIPSNVNEASSVDENVGSEMATVREHSSSIDHDYCTLNNAEVTGPFNQDKLIADTPSKKKQKSPKKKVLKQHNNSSSSSDSSSDSGSSCSCGDSSCSCSSSSSNSSSSSSTDSDSSSSAGKRRNGSINKREKKRDKLKNKRKEDATKTVEPLPPAEEEPVVDLPVDMEEPFIRESDLETDETSTDEEFYDKYPQRHANQLLAEKRNQLMVLAAVASGNDRTASPPVPIISEPAPLPVVNNSPEIEATPPPTPVPSVTTRIHPQSKRKVKSKKRKKSSQGGRSASKSQNVLYETPQPSTSFTTNHEEQMINDSPITSSPLMTTPVPNQSMVDNNMFLSNQPRQRLSVKSESHSSKRQSKRRPVRNKFYGYSSEEDDEHHVRRHPPPSKWKKTSADANAQHHVPQHQPQPQFHNLQQQQFQAPPSPVVPEYNFLPKVAEQPVRTVDDHRNLSVNDRLTKRVSTTGSSSSSEEDSESDSERTVIAPAAIASSTLGVTAASEKDDKLYCYCQCPYDEVSEMIACDGTDCAIEWFHFECVGIMVPPKGKWYCPDCRKRRGLS